MKKLSIVLLFSLVASIFTTYKTYGQGSAGSRTFYDSRYVVDMPTAGVLPKGAFSAYAHEFAKGGLMLELSAAPFTNFNLGLSYGGSGLIGDYDKVSFQNLPGIHLTWRVIDETISIPAVALGAGTQGRGFFCPKFKRFQTMSPGIFIAASKTFSWAMGSVAFHGGLTYSFEPLPQDRSVNFYAGLEQSIGSYASINLVINPTIDDKNKSFMKEKGLLNAALRWSISKGLTVELQVRDMLGHINNSNGFSRDIGLEFTRPF
jgi:hypothetical protein